jgi:hypothetical protein
MNAISTAARHVFLLILIALCIDPGLLASASGLRIEGRGVFIEALNPASTNGPTTTFNFDAQIAMNGRYRLEAKYNNLHDTLVFDGTQTIVYGEIYEEGRSPAADIRIVAGPNPEHLHGYVQAAWAASVFNTLILAKSASVSNIGPNSLTFLTKPTFFRKNFGEELLAQLKPEIADEPDRVRLSAYLPGNATRDGAHVFTSHEYRNGLLVHQISFGDRDAAAHIYRKVTMVDYLPYRSPASRDDVRPVLIHELEIRASHVIDSVNLTLPPLKTLVAVMDYSRRDGNNRTNAVAYGISKWADLKRAQVMAQTTSAPKIQRGPYGSVLAVCVVIVLTFPLMLFKILLTRRQQT